MLTSLYLHKKSSEVSIKTRSTPASLSIQGQDTKRTTVKWPIRKLFNRERKSDGHCGPHVPWKTDTPG